MLRFAAITFLASIVAVNAAFACDRMQVQAARDEHADDAPIFLGRAVSAHSYVDPRLGVVMTEYSVATVECVVGECAPFTTVVMLGGEVGDLVTRVAGKRAPLTIGGEPTLFRARSLDKDARTFAAPIARTAIHSRSPQ